MEDGSVYHLGITKDEYEDWERIECEEIKDISNIELYHQHDLGIITDEEFEEMRKREDEELDQLIEKEQNNRNKFKTLVDELEMSLDPDAMKLLRDHKHLL